SFAHRRAGHPLCAELWLAEADDGTVRAIPDRRAGSFARTGTRAVRLAAEAQLPTCAEIDWRREPAAVVDVVLGDPDAWTREAEVFAGEVQVSGSDVDRKRGLIVKLLSVVLVLPAGPCDRRIGDG